MVSATAVVKAITSCFTSFSISRIRPTSKAACARSRRAASAGTTPNSASASEAASSTSSHCSNLFWSLQIRPISGRVYREIMVNSILKYFRRAALLGDRQPRRQPALLQRLGGDHLHNRRVVVLLAQMPQHQVGRRGVQVLHEKVRHPQVREVPY